MAVPKRRMSRANTRMRRSTWKAQRVQTVECPTCKQAKLPHVICAECGSYAGQRVLEL